MSQINPNNIDQSFPVPGQDNDSQGFRDNFNQIKVNLGRARDEITELQSKVVLKLALSGQTLNNNMSNQTISNVTISTATINSATLTDVAFTNPVKLTGSQALINADSDAVSLTTTTTRFINNDNSTATATLADGAEGQVKFLVLEENTDEVEITVASPGWGGSGVITLNNAGDACTLLYINSKWFCVGNNGAVFDTPSSPLSGPPLSGSGN
jgi:hypothetical protein